VVPERQALPALAGFSPEENAAFSVNYITAWVALFELARLRPGDRVLVQAAAGGVGTAAVQLAKRLGCTVYGTAASCSTTFGCTATGSGGWISSPRASRSAPGKP